MRTTLSAMIAVFATICPVRADYEALQNLPLGPQKEATIERLAGGYNKLAWDGVDGRTYLVQFSANLANWNYVPAVIPGSNNPQTMRLQSDAPSLFFRLVCDDGITIDPEATALPDWWQLVYFGATGQAPNADPDGDGISNLDEYKQGTSPVDFFNGSLYNIWIAGGGDQRLLPGQYSPVPFSVSVNYGMSNAPVTFMAGEGGAKLSATSGGALASTLTVRADSDGKASVYLYLPTDAPVNNRVTAYASTIEVTSAGGVCQTISATTSVTKTDPSVAAPTGVTVVPTSPTSIFVTWTNNSDGGTLIETSVDDGVTWQVATETAPGVSSSEIGGMLSDTPVSVRVSAQSTSGGGGSSGTATQPVIPLSVPLLLGEQSSGFRSKYGYPGLQMPNNRYLKKTTVTTSTETDDDGDGGSTTSVHVTDALTGTETVTTTETGNGGGDYGGVQVIASDTSMTRTGTDADGSGETSVYSCTLAELYTTAALKANLNAHMTTFNGDFSQGICSAFVELSEDELTYSLVKLHYKWKGNKDPNHAVVWDESYIFAGDTEWGHRYRAWRSGDQTESPVYEIDPTALHGGQNATYEVVLVPLSIQPDDGMPADAGSMVDSNKGISGEKHFVSPKKAGEYVTIKATGFDDSSSFGLYFRWDGNGVESLPGDPTKCRVKRDATGKFIVRLLANEDDTEVARINVWVIWASCGPEDPERPPRAIPPFQLNDALWLTGLAKYKSVCEPQAMFDLTADVPALNTIWSVAPPGGNHPWKHTPLKDGAVRRIDISRQVRVVTHSSDPAVLSAYLIKGPNVPNYLDTPNDPAEGNDDPDTATETSPYADEPDGTKAVLPEADDPSRVLPNNLGANGATFEEIAQFQEFVRVQVGSRWYVCSDYYPTQLTFKAVKKDGQWIDDGSVWTEYIHGNPPLPPP